MGSHPPHPTEGKLQADECNGYISPHATFKAGSTAGDSVRRAGLTTSLRTLLIVRARALMLTKAPSVVLTY